MGTKLTETEIAAELVHLPGWERTGGVISRTFDRHTFRGSIAFVNTIADIAERADHHPDIDIRYTKVRVALTTHDSGGLTKADFLLARQLTAAAD